MMVRFFDNLHIVHSSENVVVTKVIEIIVVFFFFKFEGVLWKYVFQDENESMHCDLEIFNRVM